MKVVIISARAECIALAAMLEAEGHEVLRWVHAPESADVYEGIAGKGVSRAELRDALDCEPGVVVFDGCVEYGGSEADEGFLRDVRGLKKSPGSNKRMFGALADELSSGGITVIGSARHTEAVSLGLDAEAPARLAEQMGVPTIASELWKTFKPELRCAEIVWWDGARFGNPMFWMEDRSLLAGGIGGQRVLPEIGCLWPKPQLWANWTEIAEWLKKVGYVGPLALHLMLTAGGVAYFERLHCGFEPSWSPALWRIGRERMGVFLENRCGTGLADDVVTAYLPVHLPPWPYDQLTVSGYEREHVQWARPECEVPFMAKRLPRGELSAAGEWPTPLLVMGHSSHPLDAISEATAQASKVEASTDLQYRVDGYRAVEAGLALLNRWGSLVPLYARD